jgi:hypothetical protein
MLTAKIISRGQIEPPAVISAVEFLLKRIKVLHLIIVHKTFLLSENVGGRFHHNFDTYLPNCTVSYPRKL